MAARQTRGKSAAKKRGLTVDFTGVSSGGGGVTEDGVYTCEVGECELSTSDSSGEDYLAWQWKVQDGKFSGRTIFDNTSLQPQALWKLRKVLECLGVEVEDGEMELDPSEYIGLVADLEVGMEQYEGKPRARVIDIFPEGEGGGDEQPEPEPETTRNRGGRPAKASAKSAEPAAPAAPARRGRRPAAAPAIEVGSKVSFEDEGEAFTGKVVELLEGNAALVKVGRDEWELNISDLTLA